VNGMAGLAAGRGPDLLPGWLGAVACAVFAAVALSHLRHMAQTGGQRRPWHACHVLMAVGMALMYLQGGLLSPAVMQDFWHVALAGAGVLAAVWALWGASGAVNPVWLLTALDVGAMLFMFSGHAGQAGHAGQPALGWVISTYLVGDACLWVVDAYRRLDGSSSILRWLPVVGYEVNGPGGLPLASSSRQSLLGELDISPSMVVMTLGMAYMLVAMQLMA
jgi:hypothetical protein